jgi:hypothetical protein
MENRNAEYAASNTSDVTYDVQFTIRPDVFLTSSGWPVTHKHTRPLNIVKGTVPVLARGDRLNVLDAHKPVNTRIPMSYLTIYIYMYMCAFYFIKIRNITGCFNNCTVRILLFCTTTNQCTIIGKLLYCSYMFRHYCVILREFVISTLLTYISMLM